MNYCFSFNTNISITSFYVPIKVNTCTTNRIKYMTKNIMYIVQDLQTANLLIRFFSTFKIFIV